MTVYKNKLFTPFPSGPNGISFPALLTPQDKPFGRLLNGSTSCQEITSGTLETFRTSNNFLYNALLLVKRFLGLRGINSKSLIGNWNFLSLDYSML